MSDVVVVTGAAGALGRAVLDELRGREYTVAALDRPGAALDEVGSGRTAQDFGAQRADLGVAHRWSSGDKRRGGHCARCGCARK